MTTKAILLLILGTIFFTACQEEPPKVIQNNLMNLYQDQTSNSKKSQAKSLAFIFPSNNSKLAGRILMPLNTEPKTTIIFLHGNPGFEKNEDIGQALRRGGFNSVFFSYSGTWGNEGVFNYPNALHDLTAIIDYLVSHSKVYKIDTNSIYVCGFSMGADIAIISANKNPRIKGVISIDPWNGYYELKHKSEKGLKKYMENVDQRPCINVNTGLDFVNSIIQNPKMNLKPYTLNNTIPSIYIFSNDESKNSFKQNCALKTEQHLFVIPASDHSFSDKRISLTNKIATWLIENN